MQFFKQALKRKLSNKQRRYQKVNQSVNELSAYHNLWETCRYPTGFHFGSENTAVLLDAKVRARY